MSSLDPLSRALIQEAEGTDLPTANDRARLRERMTRELGVAALTVAAGATAAKGAVATGASAKVAGAVGGGSGMAVIAKLLAGVVVVSAVGAGVVLARRADTESTRAERTTPALQGGAPVGPTTTSARELASSAPNGDPPALLPPASVSTSSERRSTPALPSPHPPPSVSAAAAATAVLPRAPERVPAEPGEGEVSLLRRAQAANEAGDGIAALDALDTHARRYPEGVLADQRVVERVIAVCTIARAPAAREAAVQFLAAHPRSSQAPRVRRACGIP